MKLTLEVPLNPAQLAQAFCDMNDEQQAQFFIEAAKLAADFPPNPTFDQWHAVGRHLRTCSCSGPEARELVRQIAAGMEVE